MEVVSRIFLYLLGSLILVGLAPLPLCLPFGLTSSYISFLIIFFYVSLFLLLFFLGRTT